MRFTSLVVRLLLCILVAASAFAQSEEKFDFYTRGDYRPNVPRPQSILRFDVGDHHTTYAQMEKVIEEIAKAAPDRVKIFDIGTTNEHRMMHVVAISSPENMARLDEIKAQNARLVDPRRTTAAEAATIAQNNPAIAWMAYTIHGNESSSFEAMMQVVYQLAASNEPRTLEILRNTVVLIVAGENPDGHERFATWYNSVAIGSPDRNAIEHREPWSIYGRLSHYRFNLNRDTLAMTQKETRNMQKAYMEWHPQLAVDHHGQPSQYFFPPVALPINPNLPQPASNRWMDIYGRANAAAFDANKWDYYVRDIFDAFYPGYWDMYPSLNGAIGMTYETDGGGFKGLRWTREDGTIVTFRSSIAKHYVASMTTLETTAARKAERIRDFYDFRAKGMQEHAGSKMKRVVIEPASDRVKAAELIEVLRLSNIEVTQATAPFRSTSAHTYMEKESRGVGRTFPAGSYVVDLNQPQRIFIKSILEQDTPQDKAFVDDNMRRFQRNQMRGKGQAKEDYGFYDLTAWSLPLAFGVDAYWTEDATPVTGNRVTDDSLRADRMGSVSGRASIAYIVPYETDSTGAMMIRLAQQGVRVSVTTRSLNAAGRNWPAGTFVIRVTRNAETVHDAVAKAATELGARVYSANTGFSDEGDTGVGGEAVVAVQAPKIALVGDEGVDGESYGSIWWTFDKYGITFTPLSVRAIRNGALKNYNVVILPDGSVSGYFSNFGTGGINTLKEFAANGGTVITTRGASVFAALKDVGLTTSKLVGSEDDEDKDKKETPSASPTPSPTPRAAVERDASPAVEMTSDKADKIPPTLPPIASPSANANRVPEALPGAIMRATVDRTTYLNYGVAADELPVILASGYFFRYSKEGANALVFDASPKKPLTVSGFVWEGNTEKLLKGTAYVIDEPRGSGHVILFAEEPFYRGLFRSTTRPFLNSILFNGVF
ncbi:MAG TPA: M14 family zinc carboxypeptidase [Pyrinomonadaceae bacterium]|nr:M14 family zinc carboxypeptidase [Pyrinomonadaceae bacterium]